MNSRYFPGKCNLWWFLIVSVMVFVTVTNCFHLSRIPTKALEDDDTDTSETIRRDHDRSHVIREEEEGRDIVFDSQGPQSMTGHRGNNHKQSSSVVKNFGKQLKNVQRLLDGSSEVKFEDHSSPRVPVSSKLLMSSGISRDSSDTVLGEDQFLDEGRHASGDTAKPLFTCDVSHHLRQCPKSAGELEDHIERLLSSNIKTLRDHVKGLKGHYIDNGFTHEDKELSNRFSSDQENDRAYSINEKKLLMRANEDLVKMACYLNKAKNNSRDHGDDNYDDLHNILKSDPGNLHSDPHNYYKILCDLRIWMNEVNVSISDVIQIEDHEFLNNQVILPNHIRKQFEYTILTGISEYLNRLELDLKLVKLVKEWESQQS